MLCLMFCWKEGIVIFEMCSVVKLVGSLSVYFSLWVVTPLSPTWLHFCNLLCIAYCKAYLTPLWTFLEFYTAKELLMFGSRYMCNIITHPYLWYHLTSSAYQEKHWCLPSSNSCTTNFFIINKAEHAEWHKNLHQVSNILEYMEYAVM